MQTTSRLLSLGAKLPPRPGYPAAAAPCTSRDGSRRGRVLIIGQASDDMLAVERSLTMDHCGVRRMDDGWQGYREVREGLADVAIVAPQGMSMDALALCWLVGGEENPGATPFLFVADTPAQALKAFGLGAADALTHPFFPAEVVARVRVLLARPAPLSQSLQDPVSDGPATPDDTLLQSALAAITRDLAGIWNGLDLAQRVGSSPKRLSGIFRARLGIPPQKYVIARKMETAAHLLARTTLPVADIARRVGYETLPNFSTTFRRHMGQSATAYRQSATARQRRA